MYMYIEVILLITWFCDHWSECRGDWKRTPAHGSGRGRVREGRRLYRGGFT